MILSDLVIDDARLAGLYLPRTRTHTELSALGLPVLSGCLVLRNTRKALATAETTMRNFGSSVLVRSDPMTRDAETIRGGDLWPLGQLETAAKKYLDRGRALILLEPFERSSNLWSFTVMGGPEYTFSLEIVGAGLDTGHLNRGTVTPHERFQGDLFLGMRPRVTGHQPFSLDAYRIDCERLGLPIKKDDASGFPLVATVLDHFRRVAKYESSLFVLSGAVVDPGERLIFWDVYRPNQLNR